MAEQGFCKAKVGGSNPLSGSLGLTRWLGKVKWEIEETNIWQKRNQEKERGAVVDSKISERNIFLEKSGGLFLILFFENSFGFLELSRLFIFFESLILAQDERWRRG